MEKTMKQIMVNKNIIGKAYDPYIIAEVGVNHEGSMKLACQLIDHAAEAGAHAVKFQSYKADKLASKISPAYWDTSKEPTDSQFKLFKKYDAFEPNDYKLLAHHCKKKKIDFLSTPFDLDAVDYLEDLVPLFKIASADITNVPLLRKTARAGKPIVLSTGASSLAEIDFAVNTLKQCGCEDIVLLHCVLNYPTPIENAQLGMIKTLQRIFPECLIGYSDHVIPDKNLSSLEAALLLGAQVLEKHFTHDKTLPGNDHYHSMNQTDLMQFKKQVKKFKKMISNGNKDLSIEEAARIHARRSIHVRGNIKKGELFTENNLIPKRPGHGVSPVHWDMVLGKKATRDLHEDHLLSWSDISK